MDAKRLTNLTEFMRRSQDRRRHGRATPGQEEAELLMVGTFCGPDCEPPLHTDEGTICQRCGSWIHKRVLEIDHPEYGTVVVGSECAKDLLGWKWGKSHENALLVYAAFDEHLEKMGCNVGRYFKLKPKVYGMSSPIDGMGRSASGGVRPSGYHTWLRVHLDHGISGPTLRALRDLNLPLLLEGDEDEDAGIIHKRDGSVIAVASGSDLATQLKSVHWMCSRDFYLGVYAKGWDAFTRPVVERGGVPRIVGGDADSDKQAAKLIEKTLVEQVRYMDYPEHRGGYVYRWVENERYGLKAQITMVLETTMGGRGVRVVAERQ
jgi:hypothetical protein